MAGLTFPPGFLFGAAVAGHQVEGGNVNSDWWWWEHREGTPCVEPSGDACDFYHRYADDVAMLAAFGLNAFRFGIEWSRIEPAPGEFSAATLGHYRRVLEACRTHGVTSVLTFQHFTLPRWVQEAGGFASPDFPRRFERFVDRAAASLGDLIGYACTINEPQGLGLSGYVTGINPPGIRDDLDAARRAADHLLEAHRLAVIAIRKHTDAPVGLTLAMPDIQYEDGATPGDHGIEVESAINDRFLDLARHDDFVGVQTYTRVRIGPEGVRDPVGETTQMGWELYPQALGASIRRAARLSGVPVVVTENGVATTDDSVRIGFIEAALGEVRACLDDGIDVRGYLHWSLLDNFEWVFGYRPRFGLVEVDRQTFERRPKPSAYRLGEIARISRRGTGGGGPPPRP